MANQIAVSSETHDHFRKANTLHTYVESALTDAKTHALQVGEELNAAKETIPHGSWEEVCERLFDGSARTARFYMRFAKDMGALPKRQASCLLMVEGTLDGAARAARKAARPTPSTDTSGPISDQGKPRHADCNACEDCHGCPCACDCNPDVTLCPNCGATRSRADSDCETCGGSRVMQVLVEVLPPDGREVYKDEPCGECIHAGRLTTTPTPNDTSSASSDEQGSGATPAVNSLCADVAPSADTGARKSAQTPYVEGFCDNLVPEIDEHTTEQGNASGHAAISQSADAGARKSAQTSECEECGDTLPFHKEGCLAVEAIKESFGGDYPEAGEVIPHVPRTQDHPDYGTCPTCNQRLQEPLPEKAIKQGSKARPGCVEVVRAYCIERENSVDPEAFFDFYEANGWRQGKGKAIKDWQAAVRTWEKNGRTNGQSKPDHSEVIAAEF